MPQQAARWCCVLHVGMHKLQCSLHVQSAGQAASSAGAGMHLGLPSTAARRLQQLLPPDGGVGVPPQLCQWDIWSFPEQVPVR